MPWFKVDDTFAYHAKATAAGNAALGLWVRAGAWSMQHLTDGFIPNHVAKNLGSPSEIRRLIGAELWVQKDEGYVFHEWSQRQPSRVQLESDREAARGRQRRARDAAASKRIGGVSHESHVNVTP